MIWAADAFVVGYNHWHTGIGPNLEELCNRLGFFHFDQIASWTDDEVTWVDANLNGFQGRVSRDNWVDQAKALAKADAE